MRLSENGLLLGAHYDRLRRQRRGRKVAVEDSASNQGRSYGEGVALEIVF